MSNTKSFMPSLSCEMKIKEAKNMGSKLKGKLFVRYYLPSGLNSKSPIMLNTREICVQNDLIWDEKLSLECNGIDTKKITKHEKLVFELRLRNVLPLVGTTFGASKLLGKAELPLEEVLKSANMVVVKWLNLDSTRGSEREEDVAKLKVEIKVSDLENKIELESRKVRDMRRNWDMCGCRDGHQIDCNCDDYDIFPLVAALQAF